MAKRKHTGTSARTRPFKRSKTSRSSYTALAVGPKTLTRKLRYVTRLAINPGASGASTNVFIKANGLFDPEVAIGGHQPMGFDQYMLIYNHFKVTSSKCTVTYVADSASNADNVIMTLNLDDSLDANLSVESMIEQGITTYGVQTQGSVEAGQISKSFNSNNFFANKKYSAEMTGTDAADPLELAFYNISASSLGPTDDSGSVRCLVVVDYIVQFSERTTLIQS